MRKFLLDHRRLEQTFWLLTFLSWLPILYGSNVLPFLNFLRSDEIIPLLLSEQRWFYYEMIGFYLPATVLSAFIIWRIKKPILYPITVLIFASCFLYLISGELDWNIWQSIFYWAYLALFAASLMLFMIYGKILSTGFLAFCWLLVIDSISYHGTDWYWAVFHEGLISPPEPLTILGQIFNDYAPALGTIAVFIVSILLLRITYLAWRDNYDLFKQIGSKMALKFAFKTLLLWWPMLFLFGAITIGYNVFFSFSENQINCELLEDQYTNEETQKCELPEGFGLEAGLDEYLSIRLKEVEVTINGVIVTATKRAKNSAKNAPRAMTDAIADATRGRLSGTTTRNCGGLICRVVNGLKSLANSGYQKSRRSALRNLRQKLERNKRFFNDDVDGYRDAAIKVVKEQMAEFRLMTVTSNRAIFSTYNNISWLMSIYSLVLLIKTFLIVYARVLFEPHDGDPVAAKFQNLVTAGEQGVINVKKSSIVIRKDVPDDRYYSYSDVQISGPKKSRSFALGVRFFFNRLFAGKFSFLHVPKKRTGKLDHSVSLDVEQPAQIIEWQLKENERVFFKYNDLIGFSETLSFGRIASLSITTLIMGRILYYYAEGPGTLYLRSLAKPATNTTSKGTRNRPFDPAMLIAWNAPIEFYVDAKLDVRNTFISSYNLQVGNGSYIRDTSPHRQGKTPAGILRFTTQFLLPI